MVSGLEGAGAVKLEFGEGVVGRRWSVRQFVVCLVALARHGDFPLVGSAAPIAAFMATNGGGRTGPAPRSAANSGRSAAEDGGSRLFCLAM